MNDLLTTPSRYDVKAEYLSTYYERGARILRFWIADGTDAEGGQIELSVSESVASRYSLAPELVERAVQGCSDHYPTDFKLGAMLAEAETLGRFIAAGGADDLFVKPPDLLTPEQVRQRFSG